MKASEALRELVEEQRQRIEELERDFVNDTWGKASRSLSGRIDEATHTLGRLSVHLAAAEARESEEGNG